MTVYLGQKSGKKPGRTAILIIIALLVAGWYALPKKISESTPPTPSVSIEEVAKWEPDKWEGIRGIKWGAKPPAELKNDDTFP